jgi:hypothetical protein
MWLISFLPTWFFHLLTLVGVVGIVACMLPIPFKSVMMPIVALMLVFGAYTEGGIVQNKTWELKVAAAEVESAKKQVAASEVSMKVVTKYIHNTRVVREKGNVIIKEVPKYITTVDDSKCTVPTGFVRVHDQGATGVEVPATTGGPNEGASEVKISTVATTVVDNYTTYYEVAEQLKSLQTWIKQQQTLFNK